jgi:hypothetical protein
VSLVIDKRLSGPPFYVYPVAYKEWPVFEYLNSNCGATLR